MSLSPLLNVPVLKQDSILEVVSKGDGSHERDEVFVTTTLTLAADLDPSQEVKVLLPMSTAAQQQPLLRWVDDDIVADAVTFDQVDRSVYDQAVATALAEYQQGELERKRKLADAIRAASPGFSQAVITVNPGQRQLRYFYTLEAPSKGDRQFGFQVLGPLATFTLQPGGVIGVVGLLPRGTTLVDAVALQNPGDPGSALPRTDATLGGRQLVGWDWQFDPQFSVTYRY